ncbi:MAG: hypothetical protein IPF56_03645 [Chloroflexi bacterium]|jgi:hypothetical protein|nr:hypothetical protein [Chloroflexota bacterium]MBK7176202.1 hypothetical protein [Chloroflexota bacterium]MBK7915920.1 hypothetical protein [Chloroflexota bacterium]MBK8931097.1 hypothetical protein [Chloroflexota bacterium]
MLKEVLHAIEAANGPVHVAELSRQLGIERTALEGMIAYWVQHGRLQDNSAPQESCGPAGSTGSTGPTGSTGHCGPTCTGTSTCAFVVKMPRSYTLAQKK